MPYSKLLMLNCSYEPLFVMSATSCVCAILARAHAEITTGADGLIIDIKAFLLLVQTSGKLPSSAKCYYLAGVTFHSERD